MTQRQQLVKPMDLVLSMIDGDRCQHGLRTLETARFFDQVRHQTTDVSIGNKHVFTK